MDKQPEIGETEQRIFDAAHELFTQKGLDGAKMQDIADRAGINKALLHYYYRSKEKLFEVVAKAVLARSVPVMRSIIEGDLPLEEKINQFIGQYIVIVSRNPYIPVFLISEMNKHPDRFFDAILPKELPKPDVFYRQVNAAIEEGKIRPIDPKHLIVNIISMCIFPFVGKPMMRILLAMDTEEWTRFVSERRTHITQFVLMSLRP